jgi:hypothetical protein
LLGVIDCLVVPEAANDAGDDAAHHLPLLPIAVAGQCLQRLGDGSFQPLQLRPPAEHALIKSWKRGRSSSIS